MGDDVAKAAVKFYMSTVSYAGALTITATVCPRVGIQFTPDNVASQVEVIEALNTAFYHFYREGLVCLPKHSDQHFGRVRTSPLQTKTLVANGGS
jgi:hypothetical protein